ncbi:hypothetical protein PU629_12750 [Pullulanibacillus sp. KACC 23026]|uniref:HAAS signaling domain-containing protein n=1 Tax=Pullulanibacillus sp. KACC 23026 TaxID=3028315 RepID=UPI0023AE7D09|nr:hypothetical protein [Pullulanibacillus sp. KACC 23026]WEG11045.1 hypothetical protein PU629_12750 [Pullulanibacillus sp. KACC 23026]
MSQASEMFLSQLAQGLKDHSEKESILEEYAVHINEILLERSADEQGLTELDYIIERLGSPEEISDMWREEAVVTPSKLNKLFLIANLIFFAAGGLLTLTCNIFDWRPAELVWRYLTSIPMMIMLIYMFFWALLGYEVGKAFGHSGRRLLKNTFLLALVPNLSLMALTVFHLIPYYWFDPLLSRPFIIGCIVSTMILYPISWLGYRWGRRASV